jgi:hypothetical protein
MIIETIDAFHLMVDGSQGAISGKMMMRTITNVIAMINRLAPL